MDLEKIAAPNDQQQKLYEIYREKVTHEDTLINFRTSWFVTLQSFLFISFSLSFGKITGLGGVMLAMVFSFVGINVCLTTLKGVKAASEAIDETWIKWRRIKDKIDQKDVFPALKGGQGRPYGPIANKGSASSLKLPNFLAVSWVVIFLLSAWSSIPSSAACAESYGQAFDDRTAHPSRSIESMMLEHGANANKCSWTVESLFSDWKPK